ncbi:MAG: AlkA N-terminal domain-containing protein [Burkholderiaceae bacterium]
MSSIETSAGLCSHHRLACRLPLDWDHLRDFLRSRAIPGVEAVDADGYRRVVALPPGEGRAEPAIGWLIARPSLRLRAPGIGVIDLVLSASLSERRGECRRRARRLLDLRASPAAVASVLGALARDGPGVRVPGAFDGFELAVRAILGQQITVKAAGTLSGRFAARFGAPAATPFADLDRAFPAAAAIAGRTVDDIASLGIIAARARSILALARAIDDGRLRLDPARPVDDTIRALRALPGIGDWTAQYIAMRALGCPDAFPAGDLIVRRRLGVQTAAQALARAEAWRPWRAYAVMHLWKG